MLTLKFSCRITPNGSMKAADLLNTLNQHFGMQLPVEKADITRLDLYRAAADGRRLPMLEHMDKSIHSSGKEGLLYGNQNHYQRYVRRNTYGSD